MFDVRNFYFGKNNHTAYQLAVAQSAELFASKLTLHSVFLKVLSFLWKNEVWLFKVTSDIAMGWCVPSIMNVNWQ